MELIEIVLIDKKPSEIIEIVREMREAGMIQHKDFDFQYNQAKYKDWSGDYVAPEHTVFIFYKEAHATWFSLRWA